MAKFEVNYKIFEVTYIKSEVIYKFLNYIFSDSFILSVKYILI